VGSDPDVAAKVERPKEIEAGPVSFERRNQTSPIGMNLRQLGYQTTDWPFVNLLRMGGPWVSRSAERWDDGRKLDLDEDGNVLALMGGQWAAALVPTVSGGKLVLRWDGSGALSVENAKEILDQRNHRITFEAPARGQVVINLTATEAGDPVRNIALIPEGLEKNFDVQVFHPLFLERLAPFSVIRFSEWQRVDGSALKTWEDRTRPTAIFQSTASGVAYEWQIELANRVDADLWIAIPQGATDDHVKQLAELIAQKLEPERRVFVEWSHPRDRDDLERLRARAERSVRAFEIFAGVIKDRSRLVRVLAAEPAAIPELLAHKKAATHADALAVSAYFGSDVATLDQRAWLAKASTIEVLEHLEKKSLPAALETLTAAAKIAKQHELDLIAYEGGPYLAADERIRDDAAVGERLDAVNRDPRMRKLTVRWLQAWREAGGKTFAYYAFAGTPSRQDRFAALEHIDQPIDEANKYDALLQFIEANPRWW
jgi:hypothetical protein